MAWFYLLGVHEIGICGVPTKDLQLLQGRIAFCLSSVRAITQPIPGAAVTDEMVEEMNHPGLP